MSLCPKVISQPYFLIYDLVILAGSYCVSGGALDPDRAASRQVPVWSSGVGIVKPVASQQEGEETWVGSWYRVLETTGNSVPSGGNSGCKGCGGHGAGVGGRGLGLGAGEGQVGYVLGRGGG